MMCRWAWTLVLLFGLAGCASAESGASAAPGQDDAWILSDSAEKGQGTALSDAQGASDIASAGASDAGYRNGDGGSAEAPAAWAVPKGVGLTVPGPQNTAKFRALLQQGKVPAPGDFSMAGWLNEHHAQLPPANPAHPIDLHPIASLQVDGQGQGEVLLQLGVNTTKALQELQPPVAMVFVVDKSGSLGAQGWQAIQAQLPELGQRLPAGSWLAVVAFSSGAEVVRPMAAWQDAAAKGLAQQLGALQMGDGTDLYAGVEAALKELALAPKEIAQRRVLLISDGAITKGDHTPAEVLALAKASGASFSTVAYGLQAQLALLAKLASQTAGTHYSAASPAQLIQVLDQHAATLLVAVAEKLAIRVDLAAGWSLLSTFGLPVVTSGSALHLGDFNNAPDDADAGGGSADVSGPDPGKVDAGQGGVGALVAALYPADHSGLVLLRLRPPSSLAYQPGIEIAAAQVQWSYALTQDHKPLSHTAPVQLKGLVAIPDGGYQVFSHPEARRVQALVLAGEALAQACLQAGQGKVAPAMQILQARLDLLAAAAAQLEPAKDDPAGDLQDATALLQQLQDNLSALPASAP